MCLVLKTVQTIVLVTQTQPEIVLGRESLVLGGTAHDKPGQAELHHDDDNGVWCDRCNCWAQTGVQCPLLLTHSIMPGPTQAQECSMELV